MEDKLKDVIQIREDEEYFEWISGYFYKKFQSPWVRFFADSTCFSRKDSECIFVVNKNTGRKTCSSVPGPAILFLNSVAHNY